MNYVPYGLTATNTALDCAPTESVAVILNSSVDADVTIVVIDIELLDPEFPTIDSRNIGGLNVFPLVSSTVKISIEYHCWACPITQRG